MDLLHLQANKTIYWVAGKIWTFTSRLPSAPCLHYITKLWRSFEIANITLWTRINREHDKQIRGDRDAFYLPVDSPVIRKLPVESCVVIWHQQTRTLIENTHCINLYCFNRLHLFSFMMSDLWPDFWCFFCCRRSKCYADDMRSVICTHQEMFLLEARALGELFLCVFWLLDKG